MEYAKRVFQRQFSNFSIFFLPLVRHLLEITFFWIARISYFPRFPFTKSLSSQLLFPNFSYIYTFSLMQLCRELEWKICDSGQIGTWETLRFAISLIGVHHRGSNSPHLLNYPNFFGYETNALRQILQLIKTILGFCRYHLKVLFVHHH